MFFITATIINVDFYKRIQESFDSNKFQSDFIPYLTLSLLSLTLFYPFVALHIKRLRDIKLSYWWTLLTLVPIISILFEVFLCLKKSSKLNINKTKKAKTKKSGAKHKSTKWSPYMYNKS